MVAKKNLMEYLHAQRWCNFKEELRQNKISDIKLYSVPYDQNNKLLTLGKVELSSGSEARYFLMPLAKIDENDDIAKNNTITINGVKYADALKKDDFWKTFNQFLSENEYVEFPNGYKLEAHNLDKSNVIEQYSNTSSRPLGVEQSNTTLSVGDNEIAFKLERMLSFSKDINPEFEMNEKLMRENCQVMPKTYGYLTITDNKGRTSSAGITQEFVKNKGDLWNYLVEYLKDRLQEGYLTQRNLTPEDNPEFMDIMANLGEKTQEMGDCLSSQDNNPSFTPENVDDKFIRTYVKNMQVLLFTTKRSIENNLNKLPDDIKEKASNILNNWDNLTGKYIEDKISKIQSLENKGQLVRVHGDFHLGQVMITPDNNLKFIDFAGEPGLPIEERKQKHISVRDIAGMYRSIQGYLGAVAAEEFSNTTSDDKTKENRKNYALKAIQPLINAGSQSFLGKQSLKNPWLSLEVLRKNLYEVNYEVNNRPQMAYVAVNGLSTLLTEKHNAPKLSKERL